MKKINKILLYIMVMLLTLTNLSSVSWAKTENAVADDYSEYEARVLHDLGVIDADIQFDQTMSRAEFADTFIKFLNNKLTDTKDISNIADVEEDYVYASSIGSILNFGYMSLDEKNRFFPGSAVTYSDAVKALVRALGYDPLVTTKGSNVNEYTKCANQIGIKIAGKAANDALTYRDVIQMLFSALEVNILEPKSYSAGDTEYTNRSGETPLSAWYNVYVTEGIMYNVERGTASLIYESMDKEDVRIGENIYGVGKVNAAEFLGYAVKGYYYGSGTNAENELVSVIPLYGRNDITSIYAEDIVSFEKNILSVETGKDKKNYNISPSFDIIYNGEVVSAENRKKAFDIENGTVLINKVNYAGVDTVVIVNAYDNYVVGTIDKSSKTIYDKLNNNKKLELNENVKTIKIKDADGNIVDFESIKAGDVLSVAESLGSKRINIVRSSKTIRGNLSERGAVGTKNEYIKLDGVTYYVAKNYRDSNTNSINLNSVVSISLDPWEKVADISAVSSTGYKIAILKAVAKSNGIDSKGLSMKIFDRNGKMSVYKAIDRVVIDNYRTKDADDAERVLTAVTGVSVYQPIRYILNSDGLIANIDTTYYNESAGESEESLRYIWRSYKNDYTTRGYGTDIQYMYWANKNFGRKFFADQWMTLMKLPRQDTADDKFFITEAEWVSGRYYYVDALAVGRDNFCADVVIQYYDATEGSTEGQTIRYGLVTDVVYALDDDGGSAYRISYIDAYGGGTRTRFVDSSCSITDAASIKQGDENTYRISEGDFVCFSTDAAEMIAKAEVIYDAETGMWASDLPHIRADRTEGIVNCNMEVNELFHGYVLQNGTSYIRLTGEKPVDVTDSVMDSAYVFRIANSKIYKYDSRRAKLVAVDASEIIPFEYSYADCAEVVTGDLGGLTPFVVIYN